jgi:hypothetical protein
LELWRSGGRWSEGHGTDPDEEVIIRENPKLKTSNFGWRID